jgi:hypothetical protein
MSEEEAGRRCPMPTHTTRLRGSGTDCMRSRFNAPFSVTSMEVARRYEDEESSYGGLLFGRDELRRPCRKRLRGCVGGKGHGRTAYGKGQSLTATPANTSDAEKAK